MKNTTIAIAVVIASLALTAVYFGGGGTSDAPAVADNKPVIEVASLSDIESGGAVATWCSDCHGQNGVSTTSQIPHLAGQRMSYVVDELKAYQDGQRDNPAMRAVVASLTDDAMRNVAAYYSLRNPQGNDALASGADNRLAVVDASPSVAKWVYKCNRCHEGNGFADPGKFPILTGQREEYLARALHAYQNRFVRESSMMHAMTEQLSPKDIQDISTYYANRSATETVGLAPQD